MFSKKNIKKLLVGEKISYQEELQARIEGLKEKLKAKNQLIETKISYQDELQARIENLKDKLSVSSEFRETLLARIDNLKRHQDSEIDVFEHNSKAGMNAFFNEVANTEPYLKFGTALRNLVSQLSIDLNNASIADIGVGPAIALNVMLEGYTPSLIHGYDFSETALDYARQLMKQAIFGYHDIYESLPQKFDFVLCSEVLEHLENPELAYKNLQNAVSSSGGLLITVPNGRLDRSGYHVNFWSPESWEIFIRDNCTLKSYEVGTFTSNPDRQNANNYAFLRV